MPSFLCPVWSRDTILHMSKELSLLRRGSPDLSRCKWSSIFPALKQPGKYILRWCIMPWFMLWCALWYHSVLLPLCLSFFFLLMNFSGCAVSDQGYLPPVPIGQWGILPAVCCLGGDLGILSILLLILLQVFFFSYTFPPPLEIELTGEMSLNRKQVEGSTFLSCLSARTRYTQTWTSDQKQPFRCVFWTSLI